MSASPQLIPCSPDEQGIANLSAAATKVNATYGNTGSVVMARKISFSENFGEDSSRMYERPRKISRMITPPAYKCDDDGAEDEKPVSVLPAPYFYYRDHSEDPNDDPYTPLTPPGRVPNFPAKMHAILSNPDLVDVVTWMPHGRSWRVLKPREFEIRVIPAYFEHSKYSSFIRQANGWGFRRITQGKDRNSYYHELFLRGLPHLCKKMKRPGVSEKPTVDPDHEPDLYSISEKHPLPEKPLDDESIECTVLAGPKTRMPVHYGALGNIAFPINPSTFQLSSSYGIKKEDETKQEQPASTNVQNIPNIPSFGSSVYANHETNQDKNHFESISNVNNSSFNVSNTWDDNRLQQQKIADQQKVLLQQLEFFSAATSHLQNALKHTMVYTQPQYVQPEAEAVTSLNLLAAAVNREQNNN